MGSPGTVPAREVDRGAAAELPPNQAKIQPGEAGGQKLPLVTHNPELVKWQNRLLPLMSGFVIALALAFFVLSTRTLGHVNEFVETEHGELREQINAIINAKQPDTSDDVVRRGLLMLEAEALDRRYHQASALLMSRVWAKNLAFMTGVIMAFIGAIFILGKLSETPWRSRAAVPAGTFPSPARLRESCWHFSAQRWWRFPLLFTKRLTCRMERPICTPSWCRTQRLTVPQARPPARWTTALPTRSRPSVAIPRLRPLKKSKEVRS